MSELPPLVDRDVPGPSSDFVGYGRKPPSCRWPDGARVALNLVVNYEEGSEYSMPAGDGRNEAVGELPHLTPPEYRDLRVESVYEYGSRAGDLAAAAPVRGVRRPRRPSSPTAVALERNPAVAQAIA